MKKLLPILGITLLLLGLLLWNKSQPKNSFVEAVRIPDRSEIALPAQRAAPRLAGAIKADPLPKSQPRDIAEICLSPSIPVETIKAAMDKSMAEVGGVYFTHRQIRQPGLTPSLSFVYYRGSGQGPALSWQEYADGKVSLRPEDFVCVEAGTSSNVPPVRMYQEGIPDWITDEKSAVALATKHLGPQAQLTDTTRLVLGAKCIYSFSDPSGRIAHVDAHRQVVFEGWTLTPQPEPEMSIDPAKVRARDERVRAQWEEFFTAGINFSQFSLAKLTDLSQRSKNVVQ